MNRPVVSPDDLMDIVDLTNKLQQQISRTLKDQPMTYAMSALICASIKCILGNSGSKEEVDFYRDSFYRSFDYMVKSCDFKD